MVCWRQCRGGLRCGRWRRGRLTCSDSEGYLLRIAASIAEGVAVNLNECLSTLDGDNIGLVVDAVLHANGRSVPGGWR